MPVDRRKGRHRRRAGAGFGGAVRRWFTGIGRTAARFRRDISGAVLVVSAAMMITTMGLAGLAVDVGGWYTTKRSMQSAADAAAMNAGIEMTVAGYTDAEVIAAGRQSAAQNGFDTSTGAQVDVTIAADNQSVSVQISQPSPTFFASLFLGGSVTIRAAATASLNGGPVCILALDPKIQQAMKVNNGTVIANNCSIQVNSSDNVALDVMSGGISKAESIDVNGGYDASGYVSPKPVTGTPPTPDPLAYLDPPTYSGCDYKNLNFSSGSHTLSPGVYCGGLHFSSDAAIDFQPGTYVITGGKFTTTSNVTMKGDGVSFYLDGKKAALSISGGDTDLSAPTTGPLAGILFYGDRNQKIKHNISGGANIALEGMVYIPSGDVEITGNGQIGIPASAWTSVIARELKFGGNGELWYNGDYDATDVPLVAPMLRAQRVRLTK